MADTPPKQPVDIGGAFNLKPKDALAYFQAKGLRTSVNWSDMLKVDHARDFTVAKMAKLDLLATTHGILMAGLDSGQSRQQIIDTLRPELQKAGWWGLVQNKDLTGTSEPVFIGPRRLENIVATNLRTARAAGQWARIQRAKVARPYLMYVHTPCKHPRYWHVAWDGLILPVDHPWWLTNFPPNGWGCHCAVIQLSEDDLIRRGLRVSDGPPAPGPARRWVRPATGEIHFVPAGIDPGWDYNPGVAAFIALAEKATASIAQAMQLGMGDTAIAVMGELSAAGVLRGGDPVLALVCDAITTGDTVALADLLRTWLGPDSVATASAEMAIAAQHRRKGGGGSGRHHGGPGKGHHGGRADQDREQNGRFKDEGKGDASLGDRGYRRLAEESGHRFVEIGALDARTASTIGARMPAIRLSGDTAAKQVRSRPEVTAADYHRVSAMAKSAELRRDGRNYVLIDTSTAEPWHAAIKVTRKGEVYLLSLRRTHAAQIARVQARSVPVQR